MVIFLVSPVYSDWEGDIDDVTQQLDRDFQFGGKEDVKASNIEQANTQLREDTQIELDRQANTMSPLSGNYSLSINSTFNFVYTVYESGSFSAVGTSQVVPTITIKLLGTITGTTTKFTVTRIETTGAPTNFMQDCTESTVGTGVISGSGEIGTTHTITRSPLCSDMISGVVHTKIS